MANRVERNQDRRARAEALRKEQEARARRRRLLLIVLPIVAVLVIAAVVVAVLLNGRGGATAAGTTGSAASEIVPSSPTGTATIESTPQRVADDSGIDGVLAWDTEGWPGDGTDHPGALEHDHVSTPVTYAVTPPVGGPHDAVWMNAGVYTKPVPAERAVHNLEHGAVWITYRPSLPAAQVRALQTFVGRQSLVAERSQVAGQKNRYLDLSPWPSDALPAKIVISAWGHQLRVSSPSDPRLQTFVDTFRNSSTYSPEFGEAVDGIPIQTGGRPAMFGSAEANPGGTAAG